MHGIPHIFMYHDGILRSTANLLQSFYCREYINIERSNKSFVMQTTVIVNMGKKFLIQSI